MTKIQVKPEEATMVGIDIAKRRNDLLIQPAGKKRFRQSITNDRVDHDILIEQLNAMKQPVHACFEATGNYHRAIGWRLLDAGFNVHLISSVALPRTLEALHDGWDKNDPKDAQVMLCIIVLGQVQRYYDPFDHSDLLSNRRLTGRSSRTLRVLGHLPRRSFGHAKPQIFRKCRLTLCWAASKHRSCLGARSQFLCVNGCV